MTTQQKPKSQDAKTLGFITQAFRTTEMKFSPEQNQNRDQDGNIIIRGDTVTYRGNSAKVKTLHRDGTITVDQGWTHQRIGPTIHRVRGNEVSTNLESAREIMQRQTLEKEEKTEKLRRTHWAYEEKTQ